MSPTFAYFEATYDFTEVAYGLLTETEKAGLSVAVKDKYCEEVPTLCASIESTYVQPLTDDSVGRFRRQGGTTAVILFSSDVVSEPDAPALAAISVVVGGTAMEVTAPEGTTVTVMANNFQAPSVSPTASPTTAQQCLKSIDAGGEHCKRRVTDCWQSDVCFDGLATHDFQYWREAWYLVAVAYPQCSCGILTTSEPTPAPTVPLTPTVNDYCMAGYGDYGTRYNWGLGKIMIVTTHKQCSDRCTQFSGPQFSGGCKAYMTGMYYGMLFCRSYGGNFRTEPCPSWAIPTNPGVGSGALGSLHPSTNQENLGGNCCSNSTFVDA